ncbi:MAG: anhydro-N-acetylmuramic acid kinase, partial [Chloroflexia bacterium]|nr:anhydro-N-acetylmuramic acid kinase [Chloroflexia bacterium]
MRATVEQGMRVMGMISGTSVDAIDVAICDLAPDAVSGPDALTLRLVAHAEQPFPPTLRERTLDLLALQAAPLADLTELNFQIGAAFADAALQTLATAGIGVEEIDLVASHGQTLYHLMESGRTPSTWQAGEAAVIAQRLGVTVLSDFRVADVAAGGQGAPLVSYLDALLFAGPHTVALQNIGGIGNVTFVPGGSAPEDAYAFDTGPGNALLDRAARVFGLAAGYDEGGQMALRGTVHNDLLAELLAHPYFTRQPPKSTGREVFGDDYADEILARAAQLRPSADDTMATLAALTADSIVRAYRSFGPPRIDTVHVSGGGARNRALMERLRALLPQSRV